MNANQIGDLKQAAEWRSQFHSSIGCGFDIRDTVFRHNVHLVQALVVEKKETGVRLEDDAIVRVDFDGSLVKCSRYFFKPSIGLCNTRSRSYMTVEVINKT